LESKVEGQIISNFEKSLRIVV